MKKYRFDINEGDYIKFKSGNEHEIYYARVWDIHSRTNYIGVKIDEHDKRHHYPTGLNIYILRKQILHVYPHKLVEYLNPRLALKHIWSDFIFREVKTTKCSKLLHVEYRYIGKTGFEKIKRFKTLEEAYLNISPDYHHNVVPLYTEYYGFTTCKAIRSNDIHVDREIFFSKKCYSELDWSNKPTGDFNEERTYNNEAPLPETLICGIVEHGEKGLFYRKWFVCSREFLTLWTMVCEPYDHSLYENVLNDSNEWNYSTWNKIEKPKRKIKEFDILINELDTSFYSLNLKQDFKTRRSKYLTHNLERAALYYPNRYKQIAEVLFSKGYVIKTEDTESYSEDFTKYTSFQKSLVKKLLWPKTIK